MNDILEIILFASITGLPIIIGGGLSSIFQTKRWKLKSEINHIITAFAKTKRLDPRNDSQLRVFVGHVG